MVLTLRTPFGVIGFTPPNKAKEQRTMGTRADFYIGAGKDAEWLGSVAWDGYQWDEEPDCALMTAKTADEFRAAVAAIAEKRRDFTRPDQGWPWPWNDSHTTDYAYMLIDGKVSAYCFGRERFINEANEHDTHEDKTADFPDMSARKNVTFGDRSGVIVLSA